MTAQGAAGQEQQQQWDCGRDSGTRVEMRRLTVARGDWGTTRRKLLSEWRGKGNLKFEELQVFLPKTPPRFALFLPHPGQRPSGVALRSNSTGGKGSARER